jgi:hypothetical protein
MPTTTTTPSTDRQRAFARKLAAERPTWQDDLCAVINRLGKPADTIERAFDLCYDESKFVSKSEASNVIDCLLAAPRPAVSAATAETADDRNARAEYLARVENGTPHPTHRPNRYEGTCGTCRTEVAAEAGRIEKIDGRWATFHLAGECPEAEPTAGPDLRPMERFTSAGLVRVAVPGGDTRLKLRIKFARNGSVYVDDAAEYGEGRNYGRQAPGRAYEGDVSAELAAVVADPQAAIVRYTELVGRCGICNRHLEDKSSVARGVGPVCAAKLGLA